MSLINSAYLAESVKIDLAVRNGVQQAATLAASTVVGGSSVLYSPSFSLKNCDKVTIIIGAGPLPAAGACITGKVLVGVATANPTAMSSLVGAVLNLCSASTAGTFGNVRSFSIISGGTITSASTYSLTIDGKEFDGATAADSTALLYGCSAGTVIPESLATLIEANCTYLKVTKIASAATHYELKVSPRFEAGRTMTVASTAGGLCPGSATGADVWGVRVDEVMGVIEFNANDVLATNSSYSNFAVKLGSSNSSVIPMEAYVIRYPLRHANGTAAQCEDGSTRSYTITRL